MDKFPVTIVSKPGVLHKHWPALLLAVLFGFSLVLPALVARIRYGVAFDSPANIRANDEYFYFARIREVIDGYSTIGNAYLWEHKDKPPSPVFLGEYLAAQPIKFGGIEVVSGDVFYDLLLPPVVFILAYCIFFTITAKRWLALLLSVLTFWGIFPNAFGRAVSPQINFIFWLSQFVFTFLLFRDFQDYRRRIAYGLLAAFNFGLLFYLYTYYWTFWLAFFVFFAAFLVLRRHIKEAKWVAGVVAGGFVVAIPYFKLVFRVWALPEYSETLRRIGMIDSHFPSGIWIVLPAAILFVLVVFLLWRRIIDWDIPTIFISSGVFAAVASVNQHVITGKNLEFSSHYDMQAFFWFMLFTAYLISFVWEKKVSARFFIVAALVVVASAAAIRGVFSAKETLSATVHPRVAYGRWLPVFRWIDENIKKDDVIYAPSGLSSLIPIYTHANVYFAVPVRLAFLPDDEIIDRFILTNYYKDFSDDFIRERARSVFGVYYIDRAAHLTQENKVRRLLGLALKPVDELPIEAIQRVQNRARELKGINFEGQLKRYRVDYVIWDFTDSDFEKYNHLPFLEKIRDEAGLRIFKVK